MSASRSITSTRSSAAQHRSIASREMNAEGWRRIVPCDVSVGATRLRSIGGEQLIVANSELLKARIRNFTRQAERRVQFVTALAFDTPPELAERAPQILREIVAKQELVRLDRSHFSGFGESSLNVETVYFMLTPDYGVYMDTQQRIYLEMLRRFRAEGIALAPPPRAVVVLPGESSGDGAAPDPSRHPRDGGGPGTESGLPPARD